MKILVTPRSFGKTDPEAFAILSRAGLDVSVNDSGGILTAEQMKERLADCDGVVLGVDPLNAEVLAAAPKLKAVAKYGVGVDNIDMAVCEQRGIAVSRTVGANADAVADYAFTLMMSVARRALFIDKRCREKDWSKTTSLDVFGKTIGILGAGAIGKGVAARAKGFSMRVLAYDVYWDEKWAAANGVARSTPEEIYREADFISIHLPLTDETRGMIGKAELESMKRTAVIVNTARGGIIDENALIDALQNNTIYGAGIDAFLEEPPADPRWYGLDNLVMGSHASASTVGATENMGRMAANSIVKALLGK
jgi:D-3-phosphoglycerate dehydrogenase